MTKREQMGCEIVGFEGRFRDGKLQVYKLPAGDGGGAYEVAGINQKYHPKKAAELKALIDAGKNEEAERAAALYIVDYTDGVLKFFPSSEYAERNPHVEFLLRDSSFNRGLKGAATILQIALGVPTDGVIGPVSRSAFKRALDDDPNGCAVAITAARETYERTSYPWKQGKRDESSKFWRGLANRWDKAHSSALTLV